MGTQLQKKCKAKIPRRQVRPAPLPEGRRWLRVSETATLTGLSCQHIYKMHRRGQLPSFRLVGMGIRIDRVALEAKFANLITARTANTSAAWQ